MKVLLLTDPEFANAEAALLRRLAAGLADEGVRVYNAVPRGDVPEGVSYGSRLGVFATDVAYDATGLPLTTPWRARALMEKVASGVSPEKPDLVHAWGRSCWEIAWAVAQASGCPLLVEIWDWPMARAATAWLGRLARLGRGVGSIRLSVADASLAAHAVALLPPAAHGIVQACPWGVHLSEERPSGDGADGGAGQSHRPEEGPSPGDATNSPGASSCAVALWPGYGAEAARVDVRSLMEAVAARRASDGLVVVLDQPSVDRTNAWAEARRLGVTDRLAVVPGHLAHWQGQWTALAESALQVAAVVLPATRGEQSGVVLEALASGVPVIARADPRVSFLAPPGPGGQAREREGSACAELVLTDDVLAWAGALSRVLDEPEHAKQLTLAARGMIKASRLGFHHVTSVVRLYDQLAAARAGR